MSEEGLQLYAKQIVKRNRLLYLIAGCVVIVLGLSSRRYGAMLPRVLADYSGDALWALMVFIGIGFLAPRWSIVRVSITALLFSYAVELSQLYHAPWIDSIRHYRIGGLILGYGFLWSDILCYTVGVAVGFLTERLFYKTKRR